MPVKRTTIELDQDLVKSAQRVTGQTVRGTVEVALRQLVANAEQERNARRSRAAAHFDIAHTAVDVGVLESDETWR